MKTFVNAQKIVTWMNDHKTAMATVAELAAAGMMTKRQVVSAVDFGTHCGVLEGVDLPQGRRAKLAYRLTGKTVSMPQTDKAAIVEPSFTELQLAFGMPLIPPQLLGLPTRQYLYE